MVWQLYHYSSIIACCHTIPTPRVAVVVFHPPNSHEKEEFTSNKHLPRSMYLRCTCHTYWLWPLFLFAMMMVMIVESTNVRESITIAVSNHQHCPQDSLRKVLQQFRAGQMNSGNDDDATIALQKLSVQISNPKNIPLFEFGRELERILTVEAMLYEPGLLSEAELIFQDYMTKLRDYYLDSFRRTAAISASMGNANSKDEEYVLQQKQSSLSNCGKAMAAAVPLLPHHTDNIVSWKYDGFLNELETDMTTFIEEISFRHSSYGITTAVPVALPPTRNQTIRTKIWKHGRWFVVQCALLLLNFVQNEWQRRESIRMADRRLAEVPPFPLL